MLPVIVQRVKQLLQGPGAWFAAAVSGLLIVLWFPPFNHEKHFLLAPFPLGVFVAIIPLLHFSLDRNRQRALGLVAVYGFCASLAQYYWIGFVTAEGLWVLILLGTFLICLVFTVYYMALGMLFRVGYHRFGLLMILLFPALWVLAEWVRTRTELSFPWLFLGYAVTPLLWLAQSASLFGVYGFSFLIVLFNVALYVGMREQGKKVRTALKVAAFTGVVLAALTVWGAVRLHNAGAGGPTERFACVQANMDQLHWGTESLEQSFAVSESLSYAAGEQHADCIVMAESALLCYLERRRNLLNDVLTWSDSVRVPIVLGALHWERNESDGAYGYNVFNTAFRIGVEEPRVQRYYKMKLVPFSEALPFEGFLPLLSRINLGESDFKAGHEPALFSVGNNVQGVPLICYEVIYPGFVRSRAGSTANVLVNITNDGWFGRTIGPYHHLAMARFRTIENGISLVRCANSGISTFVDQYGRVIGQTGLYTRSLLVGDVPTNRVPTVYSCLGNWVVPVAAVLGAGYLLLLMPWFRRLQRRGRL